MDPLTRTLDELHELHASGFAIDVGELRPALAVSDTWWDLLFNTPNVGMIVLDGGARVVSVNTSFAELLARDEDEIRRLGMAGLTHPDDVSSDADHFVGVMSGAIDRYEVEKRYLKGDGTIIWGRARVTGLRDGQGKTRFSVVLIEDVTQERLARAYGVRLQEEQSWRATAQKLNDLVLQGLVVVKWALTRDDREIAEQSVDAALSAAKDLMDKLVEDPNGQEPHVIVPDEAPPPISLRLDEDR